MESAQQIINWSKAKLSIAENNEEAGESEAAQVLKIPSLMERFKTKLKRARSN